MTFLQSGDSSSVLQTVDATHNAARISARPLEALGHYSYAGFTGILPAALAANSEVFQFRFAPGGDTLAVIRRISISACVSTTFFAAGVPVQIGLVKSTGWSAAGTGGTAITPAALMRRRVTMPNTVVATGDIRIATTAALGAGTKTLETLLHAALVAPGPITASLNGQIIAPGTLLFDSRDGDGEYPLVLAHQEGISIRSVAVPATGTWMLSVHVSWAECSAY